MAVTIKVNGTNLSLVHQGSGGIVKSTLPDVCKTPMPGGPVPIPYPVIISRSADLTDGTQTVLVDGRNPAAVKGSQLSCCTGDEAGTSGGVKSGTQLKEATWLSYSFNVMLEGRNACRLSDKLLMNHGNTACLAGIVQPEILAEHSDSAVELEILCNMMCEEKDEPGKKQDRIRAKLWAIDEATKGGSTMKAEVPYNPVKRTPYMSKTPGQEWRATKNWFMKGHRRPDVIITRGGAEPTLENIKCVVEMKFQGDPSDSVRAADQLKAYKDIFGKDNVVVLEEGKTCICIDDDKIKEPETVPETNINWWMVGGAVGLGLATIAAAICPFDGPFGEAALGSATAATWASAFAL